MSHSHRLFAISFVAIVAARSVAAAEDDTRTPLERYRGDTVYALAMCRLSLQIALGRMALGESAVDAADDGNGTAGRGDWRGCINEQRAKSLAQLQAASKAAKKSAAKEALKSYHVIYVTALQGIAPGANERRSDYSHRQAATDSRLDEAWARFEVEL